MKKCWLMSQMMTQPDYEHWEAKTPQSAKWFPVNQETAIIHELSLSPKSWRRVTILIILI
jgi:hypothetical protein